MTDNQSADVTGSTGAKKRRPYLTHTAPLFFAHRGGALLAPENTLTAFARGVELGADALELDIQTTREGELVVIHDTTVDRTTNGSGPVADYTLDDLRRLDAGYRFTPDGGQTYPFRGQGIGIPTLREVFTTFPVLRINIDLKESTPPREQRLWALIQELDARERVLVASGELHEPIVRFRRLSGGQVATSASATEIRNFVVATWFGAARWLRPAYDALQVPELWRGRRIVSPRMLAAAHRLGLDVHVWTVDNRADMDRLLRWGVDGLMSDRPDILAQAFKAATAVK
ncbi:MAG: Glycerophosphoryl diester phosphodiesterase [Ktedonobacterales bacterium]|jgi:glycerophosphoryl diester phosphodiesterase|nr:MAG: Glycerophosphoryl diester phosphodiesterase [Ktedonobacterales bacterium]